MLKQLALLLTLFILNPLTTFGVSFLPPEEAFKPSISQIDKNTAGISIKLGENIQVYKNKTFVSQKMPDGTFKNIKVNLPSFITHDEEEVFDKDVLIKIPSSSLLNDQSDVINLQLKFQGCSSNGLCYEDIITQFTLDKKVYNFTSAVANKTITTIDNPQVVIDNKTFPHKNEITTAPYTNIQTPEKPATSPLSETDSISSIIGGGSILTIIATFFGFGFLLSLTPCVFPMLPIISSVILAQGGGISTGRAFFLSVIYVLSMSMAYTILGVLVGVFGDNLQAFLQSPSVIFAFATIFFVLALSMFDVYTLQIPNSVQSKLTSITGSNKGALGVAIMGFLSALIVGPCVAAPLAGALVYIGQTGDAILGGVALFSLSMGMGIMLIVVGTGSAKMLPKPGIWMDTIKFIFGIGLIAIAVWMVSRVISAETTIILWGALAVFSAINLGALEPLKGFSMGGFNSLVKSLMLLLLVYGVALVFSGISGNSNFTDPLNLNNKGVTSSQSTIPELPFVSVKNIAELDRQLKDNIGKPTLVYFYADWCTSCKEIKKTVFPNPEINAELSRYSLIKVDLTSASEASAIAKKYQIFGPPSMLFFNKQSEYKQELTTIGFKKAEDLLITIKKNNS